METQSGWMRKERKGLLILQYQVTYKSRSISLLWRPLPVLPRVSDKQWQVESKCRETHLLLWVRGNKGGGWWSSFLLCVSLCLFRTLPPFAKLLSCKTGFWCQSPHYMGILHGLSTILFYFYRFSVSVAGRSTPERLVGVHRNTDCSLISECLKHALTGCGVAPNLERLSLEPWQPGTVSSVWFIMCMRTEPRDSLMGGWLIRSVLASLFIMVSRNLTSTKVPYQFKDLYDPFWSKYANTLRVPICRCWKYEIN